MVHRIVKGEEGTMHIPEYIFYLLLEHDTAGHDENAVQSMKASDFFINGEGQGGGTHCQVRINGRNNRNNSSDQKKKSKKHQDSCFDRSQSIINKR